MLDPKHYVRSKAKHKAWLFHCNSEQDEVAWNSRDLGPCPGCVTSDKPPHLPWACIACL